MMTKHLLPLSLLLLLLTGCLPVKKWGDQFSQGIDLNARTISKNLLSGVQEQLAELSFKKDLSTVLDSLITTAGKTANKAVLNLQDSLLNEKWQLFISQIMENLTGRKTRLNIAALRDELLGQHTRHKMDILVQHIIDQLLNPHTNSKLNAMMDEVLGSNTEARIGRLRDGLLGLKTNIAIRAIVDSSMMTIAYRMNHDIKDAVGANLSGIQKYASQLLILVGLIAAIIIYLVWRNRKKYLDMVSVMTTQIHNIDNKKVYDDLTYRIKNAALQKGIEKDLSAYLKKNQIHGEEDWLNSQRKYASG
ncbi:MAG: hypothetical protein NVSMB67_27500 [Flavisolibacter sp.]